MKAIPLIALTAMLAACSTPQSKTASLHGEVFYLQRIALPAASTLSVSLQDVSRADAPAITLASHKAPINGQVPLPFHLQYDPGQVRAGHSYVVSARIESEGQLRFITTEQHSVKLDGSDPQPLRIRVNAVQP